MVKSVECPVDDCCDCCKFGYWNAIKSLRDIAPDGWEEREDACPNLGPTNCKLSREERPDICNTFLCDKSKVALGVGVAKIIAYKEAGWFCYHNEEKYPDDPYDESITDFRQWEHLCRAYDVPFQLVDGWPDAEVPEGATIYCLEESGGEDLYDHTVDPKGVYVIGRTHVNLRHVMETHNQEYKVVRIPTPHEICLFGISAGSILLSRAKWL